MRTFVRYNIKHDHRPTPGHVPGFLLSAEMRKPSPDEAMVTALGMDWEHFKAAVSGQEDESLPELTEVIGVGCYKRVRLDAEGRPVSDEDPEDFYDESRHGPTA